MQSEAEVRQGRRRRITARANLRGNRPTHRRAHLRHGHRAAGKPVENAVVTLQSAFGGKIAETKTGVDGRYEFSELKPSVYGLIAKKKNYPCAMSSAINATDGSQIIVNLEMKDWSLCSSSVSSPI